MRKVALIPGDGIGPEVCGAVIDVFDQIHAPIEWDLIESINVDDDALIAKIKSYPAALKGVIYHTVGEGPYSANVRLRKKLDVYADVVHAFSIPGVKTRHDNIDLVVIRENTEGEYSGLEHEVYPGIVESIKVTTFAASLRLAEYAFEFAYLNNRRKVTAVHKANIMKRVDGEFLKAVRVVSKRYPSVLYEEIIIDNCTMQMVMNPWQFDVMVMPNLYGSILANIASFLVGGPGLTPGANIGKSFAMFEQGTRHMAKDIAHKKIANPTAILLSSAMMLRHLSLPHFASMVENGVFKTLSESKVRTPDIGGTNSTGEFTREVIENIFSS
jgi:isocitrate dehydrogenase (NAD+)